MLVWNIGKLYRFKLYLNSKKTTFSWILQRVITRSHSTFAWEMDSQDVTMLERAALEIRDSMGISKLALIQLILLGKISCTWGSLKIPLLSLHWNLLQYVTMSRDSSMGSLNCPYYKWFYLIKSAVLELVQRSHYYPWQWGLGCHQ